MLQSAVNEYDGEVDKSGANADLRKLNGMIVLGTIAPLVLAVATSTYSRLDALTCPSATPFGAAMGQIQFASRERSLKLFPFAMARYRLKAVSFKERGLANARNTQRDRQSTPSRSRRAKSRGLARASRGANWICAHSGLHRSRRDIFPRPTLGSSKHRRPPLRKTQRISRRILDIVKPMEKFGMEAYFNFGVLQSKLN
jgi:hypothetical protein